MAFPDTAPVIADERYSRWVGLVYVFNLIVGTGALTLPAAFWKAGWVVGVVLILILACVSFVCATFVLEAMACSQAISQFKRMRHLQRVSQAFNESVRINNPPGDDADDEEEDDDDEESPLFASPADVMHKFPSHPVQYYNLEQKMEMGQMATLLFNRTGQFLFFLCLAIYLYGDLAIYSAVVSKSLGDVICSFEPSSSSDPDNSTCGDTLPPSTPCWEGKTVSRLDMYRILIIVFLACLGPFAFFNVQKTKYLQIFTSLMRWLAFVTMITIAVKKLIVDGPSGHPVMANVMGVPALLGASIYSFMCHHSLPSLVTPIIAKSGIHRLLALDYILIAMFYLLLTLTGVFAFAHLDELYTLVFSPRCAGSGMDDTVLLKAIGYFLALFPVFTLSTSFPIIAITLRNNLQTLFFANDPSIYPWSIRRIAFPLLAVIPPILVALVSENLEILVRVTGSFAGVGIQYVFPSLLVYFARREVAQLPLSGVQNPFTSPFQGCTWLILVLLWSITCVVLVFAHFLES